MPDFAEMYLELLRRGYCEESAAFLTDLAVAETYAKRRRRREPSGQEILEEMLRM
jgi:hypothetical protein